MPQMLVVNGAPLSNDVSKQTELALSEAEGKKISGKSYQIEGNLVQALADFTSAKDLESNILGPRHTTTAQTKISLASVLHAQGRNEEALQLFSEAYQTLNASAGKSNKAMGDLYASQGSAFLSSGDFERARAVFYKAVCFKQSTYGEINIEVLICDRRHLNVMRVIGFNRRSLMQRIVLPLHTRI